MKAITTTALALLIAAMFGCGKDESLSVPAINGLSLYWDHEVFWAEGRTLRFAVTSDDEFDNQYDLQFSTSIVDKAISVSLTSSIDKGKCAFFPMPSAGSNDPQKCNASGSFYLPDSDLDNGVYSLTITMPAFEVTSLLTVTDEKVTLEVPTNEFLNSSIESVYPIPANLLFGNVVYEGSDNTGDAENFLDYLTNLGLSQATVPNYPYRHLTLNENGQMPVSSWEPDNHLIGFLYNMNDTDFNTIFEESKKYFNEKNLNIYLYTSNGDEGLMSKADGITVAYAKD